MCQVQWLPAVFRHCEHATSLNSNSNSTFNLQNFNFKPFTLMKRCCDGMPTIFSNLGFVGPLTMKELLSVQTMWICLYPSGTLNCDHILFLLPTSCLLVFITPPCHSSFLNTHMLFTIDHLGFSMACLVELVSNVQRGLGP